MNTSFAIRVGIDTPLVLRELLHLDGLLGALATARGQPLDDIPLARLDGTWQGSAGMLETGAFGPGESGTVRVKRVLHQTVGDLLDHLNPKERRIGPMSPMRARLSRHPLLEGVRAVWFTARGDASGVLDLLHDLRALGGMHTVGYGRVTDIEAIEVEDDPHTGLTVGAKSPARTMPLTLWDRLFGTRPETALFVQRRPQPPYWTGERVTCISPCRSTSAARTKR